MLSIQPVNYTGARCSEELAYTIQYCVCQHFVQTQQARQIQTKTLTANQWQDRATIHDRVKLEKVKWNSWLVYL